MLHTCLTNGLLSGALPHKVRVADVFTGCKLDCEVSLRLKVLLAYDFLTSLTNSKRVLHAEQCAPYVLTGRQPKIQ